MKYLIVIGAVFLTWTIVAGYAVKRALFWRP